jgi:hypothetical protein
MVQSLAEPLPEAAEAALKADHWERDRVAWNLPPNPVEIVPYENYRDGLGWESFRGLHYPDSRRHNFEAIVAYGALKSSPDAGSPAREATHLKGDASSTEALALDEWEDEGGGATP